MDRIHTTPCRFSIYWAFPFEDEKTVAYLQNMQNDDGSYDSVFLAFYSLKACCCSTRNQSRIPGHIF